MIDLRASSDALNLTMRPQWKKFSLLLKSNRFRKTQPVLEAKLVETLDLTLDPSSEDTGGLDSDDFTQMTCLSSVKHLRVRISKGVRLPAVCGTKPYSEHLGKLGRPFKAEDPSSGISRLSIYSPIPQPLNHCFRLTSQFPHLRHLVLDNIQGPMGPSPILALPELQSFKLRNPVDLQFDESSGFPFLANCTKLKSLALQGCDFNKGFLRHVLTSQKNNLTSLELGTMPLQTCPDRFALQRAREQGARSLDTGWHFPMYLLDDPARIGDEAVFICRNLSTLALGGPLCISPKLLDILSESDRRPLHTLSLHDVGRLRPTRPDGDASSSREKELLESHPSGISPQDVLDALKRGFQVARLELRGMGHEWQEDPAQQVKVECDEMGISLVS